MKDKNRARFGETLVSNTSAVPYNGCIYSHGIRGGCVSMVTNCSAPSSLLAVLHCIYIYTYTHVLCMVHSLYTYYKSTCIGARVWGKGYWSIFRNLGVTPAIHEGLLRNWFFMCR